MGKISYSNLLFADNNQLRLGTGSDLRIYHNGSNSFIQDSGTGDLRLMSSHLKLMDASENLVLGVQAGAVAVTGTLTVGVDNTGHDVVFYGATSSRYLQWDESEDALKFRDNTTLKIGSGSDLQIKHDGSNSYISQNDGGNLYIQQNVNGADLVLQCDNGSGGTTAYLTLDGSTTHSYFSAGNVGIGTASPSAPLHIDGATNSEVLKIEADANPYIRWVENGTNVGFLQFLGDHAYLSNMSNGSFFFRTNNTTRMTIDSAGKLGIGTTSPSRYLTVNSGAENFVAQFTSTDDKASILIEDDDTLNYIHSKDSYLSMGSQSDLHANNLNISATGNVGIGTTSPASKLHVAGTVQVGVDDTGHDVIFYGATSGKKMQWDESADTLIVDGALDINGIANITSAAGTAHLLTLHNTTNASGASINFSDQTNGAQNGTIDFQHSDGASQGGGASFIISSTEADMVLNVGGRIVATAHSSNSEVDYGFVDDFNTGMMRSGADALRFVTGGTAALDINSSQNATFAGGIQVNSPGSSFYTKFQSSNDYVIGLNDSNGTDQWWFKAYTNGNFAIHEDSVGDQFTIAAGGNATFAGIVKGASVLVGQASQYSPTGGGDTLATFTGSGNDRQDVVVSNQTNHADAGAALVLATYGHDFIMEGTSSAGGSLLTFHRAGTLMATIASGQTTIAGELEATSLDINGNADISGTLNVHDEIITTAGGSLLEQYVSTWSTATNHDILYQGWNTNTGDYIYLKAPGNSGNDHGVAFIGDSVIAFGQTDVETGAPELTSGSAPLDQNWLVLNSSSATFAGDLTIPGYINHAGDSGTKFGFEGNDAFRLYTSSTMQLQIDSSGDATFTGTATVQGDELTLGDGSYQTVLFDTSPSSVIGNGTMEIQPTTAPGSGTANFTTYFKDKTGGGTTKHHIKVDGNATFAGTIGSGAITSTGKITGTELEGTSLDINGNADISGDLTMSGHKIVKFASTTYGAFDSEDFFRIKFQDVGGTHNDVGIGQTAANSLGFNTTAGGTFTFNDGTNGNVLTISNGQATFDGEVEAASLDINGNANISGDLTVSGTTTTVNQTNLDVADNIIGLNRGSASNTNDSGIIIERGDVGNNAALIWDEGDDHFVLGTTASDASSTGGSIVVAGGNLKLGGLLLDGKSITGIDNQENFTNADDHIMTSAAIEDKILGYSYTANALPLAGGTMTGDLTISKSVGDTVVIIESDTDNNDENDNPRLEFKQDGGAVFMHAGTTGNVNNPFTNALVNHGYLRSSTGLQFVVNSTTSAMTIDTSGNSTFAGDITVGANKIGRDADNLLDFSSDNQIIFRLNGGNELSLDANQLYPTTDDGLALGYIDNGFSDLHLASGAVINFNGNDVTLTHSSNALTIAGGNTLINAQLAVNSTSVNAANKLEVHGQARVNGTMMIGDSSISNTTNTGQLHIKNSGGAIIRLEDSDNSNLAFDLISDEGVGFMIKETVGGDSGDDIRLTIAESTGNVGIGNSNPTSAKLVIREDSSYGLRLEDATGHYFRVNTGGDTEIRGDVTVDKIKGSTYSSNSFLDFDYDETASINNTTLASIARVNYIADTNGNDGATAVAHAFMTGTTDIDTATSLLTILNNGNATFAGTTTFNDSSYFSNRGIISWGSIGGGTGFGIRAESGNALSLGSNGAWDKIIIDTSGNTTFAGGIGSDGIAKSYTWAVPNTSSNDGHWYKIARVTSSQSARLKLQMVGGHSYSDGYFSSEVNVYGQLNNDNNYDLIFHQLEKSGQGGSPVLGFGQVDVDTASTDLYVKLNTFAELAITASISNGHIYPESTSTSSSTEPTNFVAATEQFSVLSEAYFAGQVNIPDSTELRFGGATDGDFAFQHNGTHNLIKSHTGDLKLINYQDDGDIIFYSDDGSGGITEYITIDGSAATVEIAKATNLAGHLTITGGSDIFLADNGKTHYGASNDLEVYHDGSNSYVVAKGTGDLILQQTTDDKDILFQSDDGSGGVATYLTIAGADGHTVANKEINFLDNVKATFGHSSDLQLYHNGTDSFLLNTEGDLEIINFADDKDIIFKSDDGSGGVETYFFLDGSLSSGNPRTIFPDNSRLGFGSSGDTYLEHDGSNGYLGNSTGHLYIRQNTDDKDIVFQSDDGSGGIAEYFRLDGSSVFNVFNKQVYLPDNVKTTFGDGSDLKIWHDGTDSVIQNETGDLEFQNRQNDGDIVFKSDDGSGGVTPYFTLDGSNTNIAVAKTMVFADNIKASFGASEDLRIQHSPDQSYIQNYTGDFHIQQRAVDKDLKLYADDGSGGVTTYLTLDGSTKRNVIHQHTNTLDNIALFTGTGQDFGIFHDGTHTYLTNDSVAGSNLYIRNATNDADTVFQGDDGSGGLTEYFRIDGGGELTYFSKHLQMADDAKFFAGSAGDLAIYHNGTTSNNNIENHTGDLYVTQYVDNGGIIFRSDNSTGGVTEYFRVDGENSRVKFSVDTLHLDNKKALFGNSLDLQIYHDGSNSYIKDLGVGDLRVMAGNAIQFYDAGTAETLAKFNSNGSVDLYHNNVKKFETAAAGVKTSYAATSSTDGDAAGDIVNLGETTTVAGKIYYYTSSGAWELADADAESTAKGMLGVALGTSSNTHGMLIRGMVTLDHDPGTIADTLFLSTTAGAATATAPSGTGDIVRVIGYCLNSTNGQIYFNPDGAFVEVTAG